MDDKENERLRRLEALVYRLSEVLTDISDRLIEERTRTQALRLTLFGLIGVLVLNRKLKLSQVMSALAETERQADPTDPTSAALAHEIQQVRSELGRTLAPAQTTLSQGVLATVLRGLHRNPPSEPA